MIRILSLSLIQYVTFKQQFSASASLLSTVSDRASVRLSVRLSVTSDFYTRCIDSHEPRKARFCLMKKCSYQCESTYCCLLSHFQPKISACIVRHQFLPQIPPHLQPLFVEDGVVASVASLSRPKVCQIGLYDSQELGKAGCVVRRGYEHNLVLTCIVLMP